MPGYQLSISSCSSYLPRVNSLLSSISPYLDSFFNACSLPACAALVNKGTVNRRFKINLIMFVVVSVSFCFWMKQIQAPAFKKMMTVEGFSKVK